MEKFNMHPRKIKQVQHECHDMLILTTQLAIILICQLLFFFSKNVSTDSVDIASVLGKILLVFLFKFFYC